MMIRETPDLIKITRLTEDFQLETVRVYELHPGDLIFKDHDIQRRYRVLSAPTQENVVVDGVLHSNVWGVEVEDEARLRERKDRP